jgi:hypothetical protein
VVDNHESGWHRMGFDSPALRASRDRAGERRVNGVALIRSASVVSHLRSSQSLHRLDPPSRRVLSFLGQRRLAHTGELNMTRPFFDVQCTYFMVPDFVYEQR